MVRLSQGSKQRGSKPEYSASTPPRVNLISSLHHHYKTGMAGELCKDLLRELEDEAKAFKQYSELAERAETGADRAILRDISEDERSHFELLASMVDKRCPVEDRRRAIRLAEEAGLVG